MRSVVYCPCHYLDAVCFDQHWESAIVARFASQAALRKRLFSKGVGVRPSGGNVKSVWVELSCKAIVFSSYAGIAFWKKKVSRQISQRQSFCCRYSRVVWPAKDAHFSAVRKLGHISSCERRYSRKRIAVSGELGACFGHRCRLHREKGGVGVCSACRQNKKRTSECAYEKDVSAGAVHCLVISSSFL